MSDETKQELFAKLKQEKTKKITEKHVLANLKQMGVLEKFRRHKERLTWEYNGKSFNPDNKWPVILHMEYMALCLHFTFVERAWDNTKHKRKGDKRKIFLNYPFVFDQLCAKLGYEHLRVVKQLKNAKLLKKQQVYWRECIVEYLGW